MQAPLNALDAPTPFASRVPRAHSPDPQKKLYRGLNPPIPGVPDRKRTFSIVNDAYDAHPSTRRSVSHLAKTYR